MLYTDTFLVMTKVSNEYIILSSEHSLNGSDFKEGKLYSTGKVASNTYSS